LALRKALGADRDVIGTELGRGYRFGVLCTNTVTARVKADATKAAVWPNIVSTELSAVVSV
jgi:DNA-binding winged helix-turn-helix (wHTH) protein